MATVNRYTNIQPARYNPRTLEELMIAPQYKRAQHSAVEDSLATVETALANVDPLSIHSEEARMEQQKMYDNITKQAEQLNAEGFSPSSKSQFLKLNKQYQQLMGPTGKLGRIQAAKAAMEKNKALYMASQAQAGGDMQAAALNWKDKEAEYAAEFEATGKISNIAESYAPKYVDYLEKGSEYFKAAGITSSDIGRGGGKIKEQLDANGNPTGTYAVNWESRDVTQSNEQALKDAVEFMNNQVMNPSSDMNKSIVHERKDPRNVVKELAGMSDIYKQESTTDNYKEAFNSWSPTKGNDVTNHGMGLTIANEQFAPAKLSDTPYSEATDMMAELTAKAKEENLTAEETQTLHELTMYTDKVNQELQSDPDYIEVNSMISEKEAELNAKRRGEYNWSQDSNIQSIYAVNKEVLDPNSPNQDITAVEEVITQAKEADIRNTTQFINHLKSKRDGIVNPKAKTIQQQLTSYMITPYTTKQNSSKKLLDQNMDGLVRGNPENVQAMMNIQEVNLDGKAINDLTQDDLDGITNLIHNTDLGSVKVMNFTPNDFEDKPGYTLRIDTKEGNYYNLDDDIIGAPWNRRGIIGDGKPVTIRVNFDRSKGTGTEINTINGYAMDFVASSGPLGSEMIENMKDSQLKKAYSGRTWGELVDQGAIREGSREQLLFDAEVRKQGVTNQSPVEEIAKAIEKVKASLIRP